MIAPTRVLEPLRVRRRYLPVLHCMVKCNEDNPRAEFQSSRGSLFHSTYRLFDKLAATA